MKHTVVCGSCGAEFEDTLPKCPYCGTMNYKGAEREYMEKLVDLREDLEDLKEVPKQEVKKEVRRQGRSLWKLLAALLLAALLLAAFLYWMAHRSQRDSREDYLWKQENFPRMEELYEAGQYEELTEFYLTASGEDRPVWEWEHGEFCLEYAGVLLAEDWRQAADAGEPMSREDYAAFLYDESAVLGIPFNEELSDQDKDILWPFVEETRQEYESRWGLDPEEYRRFSSYEACEAYIDQWMDTNSQGSSHRPRAVGFRLQQSKGFYL